MADNRNVKIRKNIYLIVLFKGGSLVVNLLLVSLIIKFVSSSEYGIWLALSSIIAWFGISDIGLGHGLRNKFAEAIANGNKELARSYVSTTYIALSCIILVIWLLFFIINPFINWGELLNADASIRQELSRVVLILFTFFSLQFVFKLITTVLTANQEPGKAAGFDFIANIFILLSIHILMYLNINGSLEILAIITGMYQVIVYIAASIYFYKSDLKQYRPSFKYFERKQVRSLMELSMKFFLIQISMIFVLQSTNIIISRILGPEQVTIYNIAYRYFTIPMTVALIVVTPLWSAFTDAHTKQDHVWMKKVYHKLFLLTIGVVICLIGQYFISNFVYKIWIGDKIEIPNTVSIAMFLNIIGATSFSVFAFILNGTGKLKLILLVQIVLSLMYIPCAVILGKKYSLEGIIIANICINIIYNIVVGIQCNKIINQKAFGIWGK